MIRLGKTIRSIHASRLCAAIALMTCGSALVACGDEPQQGSQVSYAQGGASAGSNASGSPSSTTTAQGAGGSSNASGGSYTPEPIPEIGESLPESCPDTTPVGYFQFLDDTCNTKRDPSFESRDLACPTVDVSSTIALKGGGEVTYQHPSETPKVEPLLTGFVPPELMMTAILIRRVDGVPHFRYLSTGDHDEAFQPWSTTKFLAAANAATFMRQKSGYKVGLGATVDGYALGDLISSIHAYDNKPFTSNALARYFHDIGGRERAFQMIHEGWLERPAGESFGGNYGAASPPLGFDFIDGADELSLEPDKSGGYSNKLSSLTTAEALKRLVLHRELENQRLPGIQWQDVKTILYGAEGSSTYGPWGGMSADTAIYLQTGHDIDYIERRSQGRWRTFSKLGMGTKGQFLNVGYSCLPVLDDAQQPVPGWGREVIISAHLPTGASSWTMRDRLLAQAYRAVMTRVVDGRL